MTNPGTTFSRDLRSLVALMPARTRRLLVATAALGVVSGLLEAVSVAAVAPLVVAFTAIDLARSFPTVARFVPESLLADRASLVVAACVFFAALFVVKSAVALLVAYAQGRMGRTLSADLASRLFRQYLNQPYTFYLNRSVADVHTQLTNAVYSTAGFLTALAQFTIEATVLAAVAGLLLYVNAQAAIVSGIVVGVPAVLIYRVVRRHVRQSGAALLELHRRATETTLHALGGIKDLQLLGREEFFSAAYDQSMHESVSREAQFGTMQALPRLVVELAAVCGILALAGALALQGRVTAVAPVLAIYAAAAFRLLPAVTRILSSLQVMRWSDAGFHAVAEDLRHAAAPAAAATKPLGLREAICVEDLHYSFGPGSRPILAGVNLRIAAGEWVALIGSTGAGKSTLVDILLGLLKPTAGRVLADGHDIHSRMRAWQAGIGYVPQAIFLIDDTIRANIAFGVPADEMDQARLARAVDEAQLSGFIRGLPAGLDERVGERGVRISGGERQRIGIARALYREPTALFLDEATSALDAATEAALLEALRRRQGLTVVAVTHRTSAAEWADRTYRLVDGSLEEPGPRKRLHG